MINSYSLHVVMFTIDNILYIVICGVMDTDILTEQLNNINYCTDFGPEFTVECFREHQCFDCPLCAECPDCMITVVAE